MADLSATIGYNSSRILADKFNFGTPNVSPLVVQNTDSSWSSPEAVNSDFFKVMRVVQNRMEIYGIGEVSGSYVTLLVVDNTLAADSGDTRAPNDVADLDYLATEVLNATGINVRFFNAKIQGTNISYDC